VCVGIANPLELPLTSCNTMPAPLSEFCVFLQPGVFLDRLVQLGPSIITDGKSSYGPAYSLMLGPSGLVVASSTGQVTDAVTKGRLFVTRMGDVNLVKSFTYVLLLSFTCCRLKH